MTITQDIEELFPPKAGGMVESARQRNADDQEQLDSHNAGVVEMPARRYGPVKTKTFYPETFTAKTPIVATGGQFAVIQLLARNPDRARAVIVTLDEPVVITVSMSQANDPQIPANAAGLPTGGFVLPVNVNFVVQGTGAVYCTATSATPSRVSVWAEVYTGND